MFDSNQWPYNMVISLAGLFVGRSTLGVGGGRVESAIWILTRGLLELSIKHSCIDNTFLTLIHNPVDAQSCKFARVGMSDELYFLDLFLF